MKIKNAQSRRCRCCNQVKSLASSFDCAFVAVPKTSQDRKEPPIEQTLLASDRRQVHVAVDEPRKEPMERMMAMMMDCAVLCYAAISIPTALEEKLSETAEDRNNTGDGRGAKRCAGSCYALGMQLGEAEMALVYSA